MIKLCRQKTQNQVLGRSAGVPCEVASGLRSHGFEAEADASGMEREAVRYCKKRHMLSDFKEEERKDGMIVKNEASSDGESTHRCDNSVECSIVNATRGVSSNVEKANRSKNLCEDVENARCKLGAGGVVCPSVENFEMQIVRRQCTDCKLGTGGVVCPSARVDAIDAEGQCVSCKSGVGGAERPNAIESDLWMNACAMRKPRSESTCSNQITVRKLMILFLVTMLMSGCYGKIDYSKGWSQWFDDPQSAWANGEAEQLMFQEHYPTPEWGVDDGHVPPETHIMQDKPLPECDWSEYEWNPDTPNISKNPPVEKLGSAIVSCIVILAALFKYASSIFKSRRRTVHALVFVLVSLLTMFVRTDAMDSQQAQNFAKVCNWLDQPSRLFENMHADPPVDLNDEDSYTVSVAGSADQVGW